MGLRELAKGTNHVEVVSAGGVGDRVESADGCGRAGRGERGARRVRRTAEAAQRPPAPNHFRPADGSRQPGRGSADLHPHARRQGEAALAAGGIGPVRLARRVGRADPGAVLPDELPGPGLAGRRTARAVRAGAVQGQGGLGRRGLRAADASLAHVLRPAQPAVQAVPAQVPQRRDRLHGAQLQPRRQDAVDGLQRPRGLQGLRRDGQRPRRHG